MDYVMEDMKFVKLMLETHSYEKEIDGDFIKYYIGDQKYYHNLGTKENPHYEVYKQNELWVYYSELHVMLYEEHVGFLKLSEQEMYSKIDMAIEYVDISKVDQTILNSIKVSKRQVGNRKPIAFELSIYPNFIKKTLFTSITIKYSKDSTDRFNYNIMYQI